MTEDQRVLANMFIPHAMREMTRVRQKGIRFAHYTSADTGLKILNSQRMLLRNSALMNDFSEIHHGWECLKSAYKSPLGVRLDDVLRSIQTALPEILRNSLDGQFLDVANETYLLSVSEHGDKSGDDHEDKFGRLSMWRAYAPKDGIAFIMNNGAFLSESNALNAFSSPVTYAMPEDFQSNFEELVASLESNIGAIRALGEQKLHDLLVTVFRFVVQSTKHPSFKEEREWRVIYSPTLLAKAGGLTGQQSARIPAEVMSLRGVPQWVFAIPFVDYPDEGFVGATAPDLIDRVLIGPSLDSFAIRQVFVAELMRLNVPEPEAKVIITGIPLRQQ